jgi:hypothetical protein
MIFSILRLTFLAAGWSILLPAVMDSSESSGMDIDVDSLLSGFQAAVTTVAGPGSAVHLSELGLSFHRFLDPAD